MILFFDTETTGLPLWKDPSDHPDQPHIVQLAAELCEDDGAPVETYSEIVNPGVPIPPETSAVHGVTDEIAAERGVTKRAAVEAFLALVNRADLIIGHNVSFDVRMMRIESTRVLGIKWEPPAPRFCTKARSTYILKLPPTPKMIAAGFNKPKDPTLGECIRFYFNEELDGAHDAMVDVQACKRVYFEILRRKQGRAA